MTSSIINNRHLDPDGFVPKVLDILAAYDSLKSHLEAVVRIAPTPFANYLNENSKLAEEHRLWYPGETIEDCINHLKLEIRNVLHLVTHMPTDPNFYQPDLGTVELEDFAHFLDKIFAPQNLAIALQFQHASEDNPGPAIPDLPSEGLSSANKLLNLTGQDLQWDTTKLRFRSSPDSSHITYEVEGEPADAEQAARMAPRKLERPPEWGDRNILAATVSRFTVGSNTRFFLSAADRTQPTDLVGSPEQDLENLLEARRFAATAHIFNPVRPRHI